jgi:hypothetical protein
MSRLETIYDLRRRLRVALCPGRRLKLQGCLAVLLTVVGRSGAAQEQRTWSWTGDGSAFFGYNDQRRKFTDFSAWESQNWFVLTGDRPLDTGRLALDAMVSLEPITLEKIGSPQVFQTGESYNGAPLVDRQHPHDLLMGLGTTYRLKRGAVACSLAADLVGSPALGPPAFCIATLGVTIHRRH